jgi:hypothetical protein
LACDVWRDIYWFPKFGAITFDLYRYILARAMLALRARPVLYRYCVEEVSRTRHNALFRRFITALTRGGPGAGLYELKKKNP